MHREVLTKVVWLSVERPRSTPAIEGTRFLCHLLGLSRTPDPSHPAGASRSRSCPGHPAAPPKLRGIQQFFDVGYRTIFGFDYFISYMWRDKDDLDQRYVAECARCHWRGASFASVL